MATMVVLPKSATSGFIVKSDSCQVKLKASKNRIDIPINFRLIYDNPIQVKTAIDLQGNNIINVLDGLVDMTKFWKDVVPKDDVRYDLVTGASGIKHIQTVNAINFISNPIVVGDKPDPALLNKFKGYIKNNLINTEINVATNVASKTITNTNGLKDFNLIINKQQYVELKFSLFDNVGIESIIGLPSGLSYKNGVLKGSPVNAGKSLLTYQLSNGETITGTLTVSRLTRIN